MSPPRSTLYTRGVEREAAIYRITRRAVPIILDRPLSAVQQLSEGLTIACVPKSTGPDWMGTIEAAEYLGVVQRSVYALINRGELPAVKIGRVIRLRKADVDAFLDAHRINPGDLDHLLPGEDEDESDDEPPG